MSVTRKNNRTILFCFSTVIVFMLLQTPVMNIGTIVGLATVALTVGSTILFHQKLRLGAMNLCLLSFTVLMLISSLPNGTIEDAVKALAMVLLFVCVSSIDASEKEKETMLSVFCVASAVYAVVVIYSCIRYSETRYLHGDIEMFGTAFDPNYIGIPLTAASAFLLDRILQGKRRLLHAFLYLVILGAIFFTASKGNFIGLAVSNGVVILLRLKRSKMSFGKKVRTALALVLVAVVIGVLVVNVFADQVQRMIEIDTNSDNGRFEFWVTALRRWIDKPLLGYGYGGLYLAEGFAAHNTFIEVLHNFGVVGFLLYLSFIVLLLRQVAKSKNYEALGIMIAMLIQMCFLSAVESRCVWVLLCVFALISKGEKEKTV